MAQFFPIPTTSGAHSNTRSTVFIFTAKSGAWIVRDEGDRKGGVFATHKAATRFIKHEFGETTSVINANPEIMTPSIAA